jgi:hypothetical protein
VESKVRQGVPGYPINWNFKILPLNFIGNVFDYVFLLKCLKKILTDSDSMSWPLTISLNDLTNLQSKISNKVLTYKVLAEKDLAFKYEGHKIF